MVSVSILALATMAAQTQIASPEVKDRTVTFRLRAPNAQKVSVDVEHVGRFDMEKSATGIWSFTTKSLDPDIYGYSFNVDGTTHFDPLNPAIKTNMIYTSNMVTVPGTPPQLWEVQDVPHGSVTHHYYKSKTIGDQRDYLVYTPPGFKSSTKGLPVLYLLHGFSDNALGWTDVGKAHVIMDNLIAQKKAKPMVVVMTLGYGIPDFVTRVSRGGRWNEDGKTSFSLYEEALLKEVKPAVEADYRTGTKPSERAICGLSMGGAESLFVGLRNPDLFSAIGAFSSGGFPAEKPEDILPKFDGSTLKSLKLVWMTCGTEDGLIGFQRGFSTWLKGKNAPILTQETKGGHVWPLWRRNLASFAEKLFSK